MVSTIILSPSSDAGQFIEDVQRTVTEYEAHGAIPTQWVVENYTTGDQLDTIGSDQTYGTLANVALWLANNALTTANESSRAAPVVSISVSAPGSVPEPSPGAGATVPVTFNTDFIYDHVDYEVMTASGSVESSWASAAVTLTDPTGSYPNDAVGTATASVHFDQTGDYILAQDSESDPLATVTSAPITIYDPITISAPGTVQEASSGAGVNVNVTFSTIGLTNHVDYEVMTASGAVESGWQSPPLTMNGNDGTASAFVHFDASGDYIYSVDNETTPTAKATSSPVTITGLFITAPGTIQEPSLGGGVDVATTFSTLGVSNHIDYEVLTASGAVESGWQSASLTMNGTSGTATANIQMDATGDYIHAVDNETTPTVVTNSSPVTITALTISAPGTVQESSPGAGVSVAEQFSTLGVTDHIDYEVLTANGTVESGWQSPKLTMNGNSGSVTATVTFLHSGDYIYAVNNETTPTVTATSTPITITDGGANGDDARTTARLAPSRKLDVKFSNSDLKSVAGLHSVGQVNLINAHSSRSTNLELMTMHSEIMHHYPLTSQS